MTIPGEHRRAASPTNHRFNELNTALPDLSLRDASTQSLRHGTPTGVERPCGHGIVRAYAGHHNHSTTSSYLQADLRDLATALAGLTGEFHRRTTTCGIHSSLKL